MEYRNLDLWIEAPSVDTHSYTVRASSETQGGASGRLALDPTSDPIRISLDRIAAEYGNDFPDGFETYRVQGICHGYFQRVNLPGRKFCRVTVQLVSQFEEFAFDGVNSLPDIFFVLRHCHTRPCSVSAAFTAPPRSSLRKSR